MKIVLQRVRKACVEVEGSVVSSIQKGLLMLVGIAKDDEKSCFSTVAQKVVNLRIFEDEQGKFNYSLLDIQGELLIVSQFTLLADLRKGRRPSFHQAMKPDRAKEMFSEFIEAFHHYPIAVKTGQFQANMKVSLCNDGPCTISFDSHDIAMR